MNRIFNATQFNNSIETALNNPFDCNTAIKGVRARLSHLPADKLYIKHNKTCISFYTVTPEKKQKYISKKSNEIYNLARRKYLTLLLQILQLTDSAHPVYPMYPTRPTRPTNTIQPANQTQQIHSTRSTHPTPTRHPAPTAHQTHPTHSMNLTRPMQTASTEYSTHPDHPMNSTCPTQQTHPAYLACPTQQTQPTYLMRPTRPTPNKYSAKRVELIAKMKSLINTFEEANLDIARIVLTSKQYKWYFGKYDKKTLSSAIKHKTGNNVSVRSKSERDIGNGMENLAIPYHYEERQKIYVKPLVQELEKKLKSTGELQRNLYYEKGGVCFWNVPEYLQWMNAPGSIWKTYNPRTGQLTIFDDFKIMLSSGEIITWEHEGMCDDFVYRCNAAERVFVLSYTGTIPLSNLIISFEQDIANKQTLNSILTRNILPRIWF